MSCHEFATYTARSGGQRNGTLKLKDFSQIIALSWGTEKDPNDMFVVEITLLYGKTYLVQYLSPSPVDEGQGQGGGTGKPLYSETGNALLLILFCPPPAPPK